MKKFSAALCTLVIITLFGNSVGSSDSVTLTVQRPTVLLLDLGGIFFNSFKASNYVRKLGLTTLLGYTLFDWKLPTHLKPKIFTVLEKASIVIDPNFKRTCSTSGVVLPYLICAYQAGKISPEQAREKVLKSFTLLKKSGYFVSKREEVLVRRAILLIFEPGTHAEFTYTLSKGITLLKELAALRHENGIKKYKLIALSNWDYHSFILLKKRFQDIFVLFDDVVVSGEMGTIKPNHEAYEFVLKKHSLKKHECIFIDDQLENIEAAKEFGIDHSLHFKNYTQIRRELSCLGIIPV